MTPSTRDAKIEYTYVPPFSGALVSRRTRVLILPDGKRYLGDYEVQTSADYINVYVARVHEDGTADESFGPGGWRSEHLPIYNYNPLLGLLLRPDGGVVLSVSNQLDDPQAQVALVGYQPDGTLDPAFGLGGKIVHRVFPAGADGGTAPASVAGQPAPQAPDAAGDPDVLLPGENGGFHALIRVRSGLRARLARFTADGRFDTSFGRAGMVLVSHPSREARVQGLAWTTDNAIAVAGDFEVDKAVFIARYQRDGSLDSPFGEGGFATVDAAVLGIPASELQSVHLGSVAALAAGGVMACGRLIVTSPVSNYTRYGLLIAVDSQGLPVPSFNRGQPLLFGLPDPQGVLFSQVVVQADGKVLVGGEVDASSAAAVDRSLLVARFLPGGVLDTGFLGKGWFAFKPYPERHVAMSATAYDPYGKKVVVAGSGGDHPRVDLHKPIIVQLG